MKQTILPVSITADVIWHGDQIVVARHSGGQLIVEAWNPDLSSARPLFEVPMPGGNAGARVYSFQGIVWLAYRDGYDRGHLVRLDTLEAQELTPFFNAQRPFAFGEGLFAWQSAVRGARVVALGQPLHTARDVSFPDYIPSGLSHIANGEVFSWESQRLLHPWAVGFASGGPFVLGEDFDNRGLVGAIDGHTGRLFLWRDSQMRDPRVDAKGDRAAVVAWATGGHARLAVVTPADLASEPTPSPKPEPVPQPDPVPQPNPEPIPQPEPTPMVPEALRDQLPLVVEVRNTLFPDLIGKPLNDPAKAMLLTKHVAWRLRHHGVGLAKAKAGSENNVDGFTSDIVALANGVHWDIQQDGHTGAAFARWAMEENPANYPPIASRWVPAVDPGGAMPKPSPISGGGTPDLGLNKVNDLIAAAIAPLKAEIAALRAELAHAKTVPSRVALKSAHGRYVSIEEDGRVVADRDDAGDWETLTVEPR